MKITIELESKSLTSGLDFYGETNADIEVVGKLKQLGMVLEDVLFDLRKLSDQVEGRSEASAKDIKKQLNQLEKDLGINLNFEEETK